MDKNYIIYPKDSYTQIAGLDRASDAAIYVRIA